MKKLNYISISALALAICLTACNKQLDLKPTGSIVQSEAILTSKDVKSTLVGTYNRMGLADVYGGGVFIYEDLLAMQTVATFNGTFQGLSQIYNQAMTNDNGFAENTWLGAYQVINQTNNVLANLNKVLEDSADGVEGEAKFIRGMMYFDLARIYGKAWNDGSPAANLAVPIVLTPTDLVTEAAKVPRNTVSEVYAQALSDLKDAEAKLPEDNGFYANTYAASAILARLYLQQGDYDNALLEANRVIEEGGFSLVEKYSDEFPGDAAHVNNTTEDIFAIQVTEQQGNSAFNTYYASSGFGGRGDIRIRSSFLANFEASDTRGKFYTGTSTIRTRKFNNQYGNARVVRLAEMYLIRAEANFRLSSALGNTPADDINIIRSRAGASFKATVTLADILKERRLELAFEGGFFLHDAKRLGSDVGAKAFDAPELVFPVPLREINANSKLIQNEGYE
jgi:tetratricopeptide (TPR) repeat protein